jgi:hypothetical protein
MEVDCHIVGLLGRGKFLFGGFDMCVRGMVKEFFF